MVVAALLAAAGEPVPVPDTSNLPAFWQLLGGLLILVGTAVAIWWQARRGRSDVDRQSDDATIALMQKQGELYDRLVVQVGKLQERVAVLEHEKQQQFLVLQAHSAWDLVAAQLIRRLIDIIQEIAPHRLPDVEDYAIGNPPPLYTPDVRGKG